MIEIGTFRQWEIPPPLVYQFQDADGKAMNLTGYDAEMVISDGNEGSGADAIPSSDREVRHEMATVTDPEQGKVTYQWQTGDLSTTGVIFAELWVSNGSNRFASERFQLRVSPALAEPSI